jgi:hypothetical protein
LSRSSRAEQLADADRPDLDRLEAERAAAEVEVGLGPDDDARALLERRHHRLADTA